MYIYIGLVQVRFMQYFAKKEKSVDAANNKRMSISARHVCLSLSLSLSLSLPLSLCLLFQLDDVIITKYRNIRSYPMMKNSTGLDLERSLCVGTLQSAPVFSFYLNIWMIFVLFFHRNISEYSDDMKMYAYNNI